MYWWLLTNCVILITQEMLLQNMSWNVPLLNQHKLLLESVALISIHQDNLQGIVPRRMLVWFEMCDIQMCCSGPFFTLDECHRILLMMVPCDVRWSLYVSKQHAITRSHFRSGPWRHLTSPGHNGLILKRINIASISQIPSSTLYCYEISVQLQWVYKLPRKWHFTWPLSKRIKELYFDYKNEILHTNLTNGMAIVLSRADSSFCFHNCITKSLQNITAMNHCSAENWITLRNSKYNFLISVFQVHWVIYQYIKCTKISQHLWCVMHING